MTSDPNEYESAAAEARDRGMAFIVDGKHVNADRVFILSMPDTVGPISNMRRAKSDAESTMRDMEVMKRVLVTQHDNALDLMMKRAASMERINQMLGFGKGPDTYVDESCAFTEAAVRDLVERLAEADADRQRLDWFDAHGQLSESKEHMRWVIITDSGITNVRLAMDSHGALAHDPGLGTENHG